MMFTKTLLTARCAKLSNILFTKPLLTAKIAELSDMMFANPLLTARCEHLYDMMSTKRQKLSTSLVGIELGRNSFYPNSIPTA